MTGFIPSFLETLIMMVVTVCLFFVFGQHQDHQPDALSWGIIGASLCYVVIKGYVAIRRGLPTAMNGHHQPKENEPAPEPVDGAQKRSDLVPLPIYFLLRIVVFAAIYFALAYINAAEEIRIGTGLMFGLLLWPWLVHLYLSVRYGRQGTALYW